MNTNTVSREEAAQTAGACRPRDVPRDLLSAGRRDDHPKDRIWLN